MAEAQLASHNSENIAALAKVTDQHDIILEEIQKQLQSLNQFMQKIIEAEDRRKFVPRDHHATNDSTTAESFYMNLGKPLKLDFPRFQGEDPASCILSYSVFFLLQYTNGTTNFVGFLSYGWGSVGVVSRC